MKINKPMLDWYDSPIPWTWWTKTRGFVDHNIGEQPLLQFGNCGN